jgi:hypothetical protein
MEQSKRKIIIASKFEALWIGPYLIEKFLGYNSYLLKDMKGTV